MKKSLFYFPYFIILVLGASSSFAKSHPEEAQLIPFQLKQNSQSKLNSKNISSQTESFLFQQSNQQRKNKKVKELKSNSLLNKVAQDHSLDMLKRNYFSHYSPEGQTVLERIRENKSNYDESCSENLHHIISSDQLQDAQAVASQMIIDWMGSRDHRKNLLSTEYEYMGLGCASDGKQIYCTQVFSGEKI